jgi:putative membrane protein
MIEYNSRNWFRHIVEFRRMDTLRVLWQELLFIAFYAWLIVFLKHFLIDQNAQVDPETAERYTKALRDTTIVHSVLGFVLSLLLVFRTNTAYDRWWEGRKLWGALVNTSRNLAVKYLAMLSDDSAESKQSLKFFRDRLGDFPFALKEHLRRNFKPGELNSLRSDRPLQLDNRTHVPLAIIEDLYLESHRLVSAGRLSKEDLIVLDSDLMSLSNIMGGCERILNTPIPYTYSLFLKKFVFFFILLLPLGFAALFGYLAIPLTMFVFYVLVSLEYIAEEIEEPFGEDANDLATDAYSETIRKSVNEVLVDAR